jgi:hypothetical protein
MNERDCTRRAAIQDWELVAYADGEKLEHVEEHLKHCPACRDRLRAYKTMEDDLQQILYRSDCPSPDLLRDYYWTHLSADERRRVEAHLKTCPHCAAELANLDQFIGSEQQEPSGTLLDRAREAAQRVRLIVARLASPSPSPVPALRGETREVLLFEAENIALSLNIEQETTGGYTLFGQILSPEMTDYVGADVRLTARERDIRPFQTRVDAGSGFSFTELHPGVYHLSVQLPDQRIVVPTLALKSEL